MWIRRCQSALKLAWKQHVLFLTELMDEEDEEVLFGVDDANTVFVVVHLDNWGSATDPDAADII